MCKSNALACLQWPNFPNQWRLASSEEKNHSNIMIKAQFHLWFNPRIWVLSHVLDQELLCIPRIKTQDQIRNTRRERNVEFPRRVLSRWCMFPWTCGNKSMLQWLNMHTVHCNQSCQWRCRSCWNVWQTRKRSHCSAMLVTFKFVWNCICFVGETPE